VIRNSLKYRCAKNYPNRDWFEKGIAKQKTVQYVVIHTVFPLNKLLKMKFYVNF